MLIVQISQTTFVLYCEAHSITTNSVLVPLSTFNKSLFYFITNITCFFSSKVIVRWTKPSPETDAILYKAQWTYSI